MTKTNHVKDRIDALSDSTIFKMYKDYQMSGAIGAHEKRFQIIAHEGWIAHLTKEHRQSLGLTLSQMAVMLGYQGEHTRQMMHDLETGRRPMRMPQLRLMDAYMSGHRPADWPE